MTKQTAERLATVAKNTGLFALVYPIELNPITRENGLVIWPTKTDTVTLRTENAALDFIENITEMAGMMGGSK